MKKVLLPLLLLSLSAGAALAQQGAAAPAAPKPAADDVEEPPAPAPTGPVQILEYGSFELPRVQGRAPKTNGGNLVLFASDEWVKFEPAEAAKAGGEIIVGLTNEVAHTGRQSIYVQFSKIARPNAVAQLSSELVRVKGGTPYRIAIWGQVDKKQPLTTAQRIPNLRLQVDFFQEDMETQVAQEFSTQPLPGNRNRPPLFLPNRWSEYFMEVKAPEEAFFVKMTWSWVSTPQDGETNGVMYFDDASLVGLKVEPPPETDDEAAAPAGTPDPAMKVEPPAPGAAPAAAVENPPATPQPVVPKLPTTPAVKKK